MSNLQHNPDDDLADDFDDDFADGPVYDERERRPLSPLARMLVIAALGIAVIALGSLVWFAYSEGVRSGAEEAAPVLRAENTPIKRKPEDPGGMNIPNRDKLIYDRIAPGQAQQPVERLLPPPETPVERPDVPRIVTAADGAADAGMTDRLSDVPEDRTVAQSIKEAADAAIERSLAQVAEKRPPEHEPMAESKAAEIAPSPPPAPPPVPQSAVSLPPPPVVHQAVAPPAPPPALRPAPATTPVSQGPAWRVQLASLSSEAGAMKEWQRMQQANADLLGGLDLKVQQAKLSKGTYFRIQAGPLGDRAAAVALCGKLKTRKQDCLVVAP